MSLPDWLIIGGAALLAKHGLKKEAENRKEEAESRKKEDEEIRQYLANLHEQEAEWKRVRAVNSKRRDMPCFFNDGLPFDVFEEMAKSAGRKIKRINNVSVYGGIISCNVESQTGYTDWDFNVDFNDWGHVTGTFWTTTDNYDSSIPKHYGKTVSGLIHDYYREKNIFLLELSDYVDKNKDLETERGLNYSYKEKLFKRVFGKKENLTVDFGSDFLTGEHLYPVISMLRKIGFKNIRTTFVNDINDRSSGYYYQVKQVAINGTDSFEAGTRFPETAEVQITYRQKQTIRMPFSNNDLRRCNYINVGDKLRELGFTQIYDKKIEDLVTAWITKDG